MSQVLGGGMAKTSRNKLKISKMEKLDNRAQPELNKDRNAHIDDPTLKQIFMCDRKSIFYENSKVSLTQGCFSKILC